MGKRFYLCRLANITNDTKARSELHCYRSLKDQRGDIAVITYRTSFMMEVDL